MKESRLWSLQPPAGLANLFCYDLVGCGKQVHGRSQNFKKPYLTPLCTSSEPPYGQSSSWKSKIIYLITTPSS